MSLNDLTLRRLAAAIREGEVTSREAVEASLARIDLVQPLVHAWVSIDRDGALAAADRFDATRRPGETLGPLSGVPFGVKDIIDVAGVPTRCGSRMLADAPPAAQDADCVARARAAGGIVVGKTVTQEFAAGVLSPPARNPWNPAQVPGGSSGGSAAAVATRAVPWAFGSDTGGSIRIPAAAVGVCGFKPTFGAFPVIGVQALAGSLDTLGPLGRTVDDVRYAYAALLDPATIPEEHAAPDHLRGVRIAAPAALFRDRLQPAVELALDTAIDQLRGLGAEIVAEDWTEAAEARAASYIINRVETALELLPLTGGDPERLAVLNPDLQVRIQAGRLVPAAAYEAALRSRVACRDSMARYFARHRIDAIVAPALPATAIAAGTTEVDFGDSTEGVGVAYTRLTMPFNATGQPVLSVPAGFDDAGLPIGLQFAGQPGREDRLFAVGEAYERASGWTARRPPMVDLEGAR